jgi:hypothetical protein
MSNKDATPTGFSKAIHEYLRHYVNVADAKIGAFVTVNIAVVGLILGHLPTHCAARYVSFTALAILGLSSAAGGWAIFPRLPSGGAGLIFWEDIRRFPSADRYAEAVERLQDEAQVDTAFAIENFQVSGVLHRKFVGIQIGLALSALGLVLAGLGQLI